MHHNVVVGHGGTWAQWYLNGGGEGGRYVPQELLKYIAPRDRAKKAVWVCNAECRGSTTPER